MNQIVTKLDDVLKYKLSETTQYLDELHKMFPDRIKFFVYRKTTFGSPVQQCDTLANEPAGRDGFERKAMDKSVRFVYTDVRDLNFEITNGLKSMMFEFLENNPDIKSQCQEPLRGPREPTLMRYR